MFAVPNHPGEDEDESLLDATEETQEAGADEDEPDVEPAAITDAASTTEPSLAPPVEERPLPLVAIAPTIAPAAHPGMSGHTLCLVMRVVYGDADTEPLVYLSAAVDHRLPQCTAPLAFAELGVVPADLVAIGHAALQRFAAKSPARLAPPKLAEKKLTTTAKPPRPASARVVTPPPTGPRPTPVIPLVPAELRQVEQLGLFGAATVSAPTMQSEKEDTTDGHGND
ncbi:MAG: hypothetical protein H0X24_01195 [Ktedonobacterales bacterium]|nr:hypothetical protein [Ktedonobacterales bacterium]